MEVSIRPLMMEDAYTSVNGEMTLKFLNIQEILTIMK